jgi:hypothetical protein
MKQPRFRCQAKARLDHCIEGTCKIWLRQLSATSHIEPWVAPRVASRQRAIFRPSTVGVAGCLLLSKLVAGVDTAHEDLLLDDDDLRMVRRPEYLGASRVAKLCALSMTEVAMSDPVEPLILDLLEWIGPHTRPYAEVLEVWRTSCPRLPVWEEANTRGFVDHVHEHGQPALVAVSPLGHSWLALRRSSVGNFASATHSTQVLGNSVKAE